jgi:hypothetical protein
MARRERDILEHAVHTVAEQAAKADELVDDFADVGAKVIASLGQTGIAVLGLAALALLLAIAGLSALAASSRRMASVARTD